jgi:PA14 domain/Dolichyl-phosphate-mannose-protein mannosyltransferase
MARRSGTDRAEVTRSLLIWTTLLAGILLLVDRFDPVREGLNATYYADLDWSLASVVATPIEYPSTERLLEAWKGAPPETFSASWAGSFLTARDGTYTFSTVSDDGSWVYVDGKLVVDNGGRHGPVEARGTTALGQGVHAILVKYFQGGGGVRFDLRWGRDGQALEPVPTWALTPRAVGFWRFVLSTALRRTLMAVEWLWAGLALVTALTMVRPWTFRAKRWLEREQVWPALAWIVAGSLLLNLTGLWWGLPGGSWAPDELTPLTVLSAASLGFSHGWYDRYPPFHYFVLTAAFSPMILFESLGRIDLGSEPTYTVLAVVGLVSAAAGLGTVMAVYACGARAFGRRAGLFAAAAIALVAPFVYYAKTANLDVPYLFWVALSLLFYLRVLDTLKPGDFAGFAACAALAVCTKDQAYGVYLLTPLVIVHRMWEVNRHAGDSQPLVRAALDRRWLVSALIAAVIFVLGQNLLFNWSGFVEHVRYITGGGSQSYRGFEPTVAGRAALLWLTLDLVRVAWGWPLFLAGIAGVCVALADRQGRRMAFWLAVPAGSYYLTFVNVVLYNYDRFVLPICVVVAPFAGLAFDRLTASGRARAWRIGGATAIVAYTVLYAATVDQAMLQDSRYTVERWLRAHVGEHDLVGFVFPQQYYPRLAAFDNTEITSVEQLRRDRPVYYVLDADYARAEPATSAIGQMIASLQEGSAGYDLVFRFRQPSPWPWLAAAHPDLVGPRTEKVITSALRHINPSYEVFKRQPGR